jgi:hypothetical protein
MEDHATTSQQAPVTSHQTGGRPARRELFEPGRYLALPDVLARRRDLPASAKLVWMALASHLGPSGTDVWPSVVRLAELTGTNRDTVAASVARLEAVGLLVIVKTQGKPNVYRILQPEAGLYDDQPENPASRKIRPAGRTGATGRKNRFNQPEFPARSTVLSTVGSNTPLTPQTGGEREGSFAAVAGQTQTQPPTAEPTSPSAPSADPLAPEPPPALPPTLTLTVARIEAAYREVFGADRELPAKWHRKIERGWDRGDRSWLVEVDAAAIRGGQRLTAGHPLRIFGLGWVAKYVEQTAAARQAQNAAAAARRQAAQIAAAHANQHQTHQDAQRREAAAMLAWFRQQPEPTRQRHLAAAREQMPRMRRDDVIEQLAATLAARQMEAAQ